MLTLSYISIAEAHHPFFGSLYVKGIAGQTINFNGSTKTFNGDWQRIEELLIIDGSNTYMSIRGIVGGTTALDFQLWGAQGEAGSYATSYIPTTSASVTRNADVISKTGISSLIGQTEGTMFVDIDFNNIDQTAGVDNLLILNNGTNNNEIVILLDTPAGANKTLLGLITNGGSFQSILYAPSPITATRYKIALAYKNNDVAFYINGSLIGTDTSATIPTTSAINFKSRSDGSWLNIQQEFINTSALWKTRLTNTQLAQLTTI